MRIEIDGSPIRKPPYAQHLDDGQFSEYVVNVCHDPAEHFWLGGNVNGHDPKMLDRIKKDPDLQDYELSIIKRGPESAHAFFHSTVLTAHLADNLAKKKESLELVPAKKFTVSGTPYPHRQREPGEKLESFPSVGRFLKKGTIFFKGDVDEIDAVNGGTVYVDGDVNLVNQNHSGTICVRGDLYNLRYTGRETIVVGGKIHNFLRGKNPTEGGFAIIIQGCVSPERVFALSKFPIKKGEIQPRTKNSKNIPQT